MNWVLITEPWCGDATHSHAFIEKLAQLNPHITLQIQNRDSPNSEIENYLINGTKSIPKLISRDQEGRDLFTWGPRPKEAQEMVMNHKQNPHISPKEKTGTIQMWYNKDKGLSIQNELLELVKKQL